MSARDDMLRIVFPMIDRRSQAVFVIATTIVQAELTDGGPVTGAPGQPVDQGILRASYIPEFVDASTWRTTTNEPYAKGIEDGVGPHGPLTLRSKVGGFHSIKLIHVGFPRIVAVAVAQARAA